MYSANGAGKHYGGQYAPSMYSSPGMHVGQYTSPTTPAKAGSSSNAASNKSSTNTPASKKSSPMSNASSKESGPSDLAERTQVAFRQLIAHLQKVTPRGQKPILATPPQTDLYRCAMYLHQKLSEAGVPYYFCGGFACINVGMTARSTADIDIAVPNGAHGYGTLLNILSRPPFIQDKTGTLPRDSYYFFVESSGNFVEVDGVIAGFMQFPTLEQAKVIQAGKTMKLNFLEPTGLLKLKFDAWSKKSRREGPKRNGDITDITSLRDLLISNRARMDLVELKGEFAKGLREWVREFGDLKQWQKLDPKYRG